MDQATFAHLCAWVQAQEPPETQVETLSRIMDFARDYPDLLERLTWFEMRDRSAQSIGLGSARRLA